MNRSHAEDLELAQRCASGDPEAWDRFVLEYRPVLYRAADALDRHGGAREVADALYAELYGVRNAQGQRQSLFRYFQGRSSLATWLRAVLAQRYVDRQRAQRRLAPLADTDADTVRGAALGVTAVPPEPDPSRARYVALLRRALAAVIGALAPRERLRLACYYVQELTLAETAARGAAAWGAGLGDHRPPSGCSTCARPTGEAIRASGATSWCSRGSR